MPRPHSPSKKATLALRFFTYGVMTVTTIVLTGLLIMVALGYQFNRTDLSFTQGGLVQLRSFPSDATVVVDNKTQNFTTPGKINLEAGSHSVVMQRSGYHDWSKQFNLAAGQLLWLNYARFIPQTLQTDTVREFDGIHNTLPSPDHRWLLLQTTAASPSLELIDYQDRNKPVFSELALPESQLTRDNGNLGSFELQEWALDSRYLLVKHVLPGRVEFIRLDRTKPQESVNVTRLFGLTITNAHFAGNSANIVYAKTDTVLRRLDIDARSASGPLVTDVRDFVVYGSNSIALSSEVLQNNQNNDTKVQQIAIYSDDKLIPVRTVPLDQTALFDYNEYDKHDYLAIGTTTGTTVDVIRDPSETGQQEQAVIFTTLDLGRPLQWLSFSTNGRMLVAQNDNHMITYDLEEAKSYSSDLAVAGTLAGHLRWLDNYYLWGVANETLYITEFDGTNAHALGGIVAGPGIMLSQDETRLLRAGLAKDGKAALQATHMTIKADD